MVNELTNVIDKNTKNKNFSYLKSHPLNYLLVWLEKRKEKKKSYKKKNKINILVPQHPKKERKKHDATPTLGV